MSDEGLMTQEEIEECLQVVLKALLKKCDLAAGRGSGGGAQE